MFAFEGLDNHLMPQLGWRVTTELYILCTQLLCTQLKTVHTWKKEENEVGKKRGRGLMMDSNHNEVNKKKLETFF